MMITTTKTAFGRTARTAFGLALGAGSVRGYAHYGVLRVLERIGLHADYVTGTSIGAIVAAGYALGQTADEAARIMEETSARAFRLTVGSALVALPARGWRAERTGLARPAGR